MKAPNPTFLNRAEKIHSKRKLITLILLAALSVMVLVVVFVVTVAAKQREYEEAYPDLVGRATDTTTTIEFTTASRQTTETSETSESATESETSETQLAPSIHSDTSPESSDGSESEGSQSNDPEPEVLQLEDFRFSQPRTQVASHQKRAVMLDKMKNNIETYIKSLKNTRIGFRYVSLKNGEELGINELIPIIPAGAYGLPISIVANEQIGAGILNPNEIITYQGHSKVSGSYISDKYSTGKKIYVSFLEHLMLSVNDGIASEMLLEKLGGRDNVVARINQISSYQAFDKDVYYLDHTGKEYYGSGRSSCFDMSNYIRYLYNAYTSNPSGYQSIINSLANSGIDSPIASAFGQDVPILHIYGRNKEMNAYTELAIIDGPEPIAVCIYVESSDSATVSQAFSTIAGYLSEYIKSCY